MVFVDGMCVRRLQGKILAKERLLLIQRSAYLPIRRAQFPQETIDKNCLYCCRR